MDIEPSLDLVKHFESCSLQAYQDQGGVWTVGWGCTGPDITAGTTWTIGHADAEALRRVTTTQRGVEALLTRTPTARQLTAMVSLAYNIGLGGDPKHPGFKESEVLRDFNAGNMPAAADAFRHWVHVKGVVSRGLVNRREAERAVFLSLAFP
jgi:lysozyme